MEKQLKSLKTINRLTVATAIMTVLAIVFLVLAFGIFSTNTGGIFVTTNPLLSVGSALIGGLLILVNVVCIFCLGAFIGGTDWLHPELQQCKTMWCFLTIFLLGFIGGFIFVSKVKSVLSTTTPTSVQKIDC